MNHITDFLRYMAAAWSLREATAVFGDLDTHIWCKWLDSDRRVDAFFFSLDEDSRRLLMQRALSPDTL